MAQQALQQAAPQDVVEAIVHMQQELAKKIQEASARGDTAAVQELLREMAARATQLAGAGPALALVKPEEEPAVPARREVYDNNVCELDLYMTVYDGDRDTYLSLIDDKHFSEYYTSLMAQAEPYNARKDLLKTALKLTPKLAPKVYEVLDRCRANIGLKSELEIYVCSDTEFNAFCYPPVNGKYLIGVTSALLERFEPDELAFVIGHEIGHAIFQHHRLPVNFLLHHGSGHLTPLHAMKLYSWKRNAELTADRVGLICSRSFDAAASAFFKLSSGVTTNSLSFQLREYIDQFADLEKEMEGKEVDPEDWYSTHPFSPMRLKALDMFVKSETYFKLIGQDGSSAELSEEQLEFDIKKIMSMMEPSYLQDSGEVSELMKNFVFLGGYMIAAANGVVEESEIKALGSLLDPKEVEGRVAAMGQTNPDEVKKELFEISEKLNVHLPVVSKLNVIKDLTIIAGADGSIDDSELEVLYEITESLNIRHEFVDHVLSQTEDEDDDDG